MNTRSTNPVSVAFAEDHILVRKGIISYLKDLGGIDVIIEAGDGRELIRKIQQYKKKPDVCIIDIIMPGMNGFETVAEIRRRWHNMKILVLSTYTDDLYVVKMIRLGVNGYLSKACSPGELKDAIVSIFERGHYYSDFFVEKTSMALQGQNTGALDLSEKRVMAPSIVLQRYDLPADCSGNEYNTQKCRRLQG